jgi:hypothetical protein
MSRYPVFTCLQVRCYTSVRTGASGFINPVYIYLVVFLVRRASCLQRSCYLHVKLQNRETRKPGVGIKFAVLLFKQKVRSLCSAFCIIHEVKIHVSVCSFDVPTKRIYNKRHYIHFTRTCFGITMPFLGVHTRVKTIYRKMDYICEFNNLQYILMFVPIFMWIEYVSFLLCCRRYVSVPLYHI